LGASTRRVAAAQTDDGVRLDLWTDQPVLQLYSAGFLDGRIGGGGRLDARTFPAQRFVSRPSAFLMRRTIDTFQARSWS